MRQAPHPCPPPKILKIATEVLARSAVSVRQCVLGEEGVAMQSVDTAVRVMIYGVMGLIVGGSSQLYVGKVMLSAGLPDANLLTLLIRAMLLVGGPAIGIIVALPPRTRRQ